MKRIVLMLLFVTACNLYSIDFEYEEQLGFALGADFDEVQVILDSMKCDCFLDHVTEDQVSHNYNICYFMFMGKNAEAISIHTVNNKVCQISISAPFESVNELMENCYKTYYPRKVYKIDRMNIFTYDNCNVFFHTINHHIFITKDVKVFQ